MQHEDAERIREGLPPSAADYRAKPAAAWEGDATERDRLAFALIFGALVGLLMGPVAASVSCWLTDLYEWRWFALLLAAAVGPFGALFVGWREWRARGSLVRPDPATPLCIAYGLLPMPLLLTVDLSQGIAGLGLVFIGPMLGLLIGALLDRAYEAFLRGTWLRGVWWFATGATVAVALVYATFTAGYGPSPEDLVPAIRAGIRRDWKADPNLENTVLVGLTLERTTGREYTGVVEASIDGQRRRYAIDAAVQDQFVHWTLRPLDENQAK